MRMSILPRTPRRHTLLILLGCTFLAFVLRVYHLDYQSLWRDEVDALRFATRAWSEVLEMFRRPGENGPLFFLALRPWLALAGHSEFALRFPSAASGTLAVPILYALVRRLTSYLGHERAGRRPALVAALLMATAPYLVWYGQESKMYALLTALVPLSLWLAAGAACNGGRWRWFLLYVITSLSFYTHLLAALAVPVQALWLLLLPGGPEARRRRIHGLVYLAVLILPYLPLALWQAPLWLSPTFETGHPFVPLPDIFNVLTVAFSRGVLPVTQPWTMLPAVLALLAGAALWAQPAEPQLSASGTPVQAVTAGDVDGAAVLPVNATTTEQQTSRRRHLSGWKIVALLLIWLLLPPLAIFGVSLGMPIFLDRYLIWIMPAFLILVAMGVVALAQMWRPVGMALLAVLLALNLVGVWEQTNRPVKSDFRSAAQYVLANRQPDDLLLFQIPYIRYTFTYYSGEGLNWVEGPYTNANPDEAAVDALMTDAMTGARGVWLIASEVPLWDERGLTQAWLEAHGTETTRGDFVRVSVIRYELVQ